MHELLQLLFAIALFPSGARTVWLNANRWIIEAPQTDRQLKAGESIWWWSGQCAPQKLAKGDKADCAPVRALRIFVTDPKRQPLPKAVVTWGTDSMLADLPDSTLPTVITLDDGTAIIAAPEGVGVRTRVCGPQFATEWRQVPPDGKQISLQAWPQNATAVHLRGEDGAPVVNARVVLIPESCATICGDRLMLFDLPKQPLVFHAPAGMTYNMLAWSDSHAPTARTVAIGSPRDLDLTFPRGTSLSARIVGEQHKPVPGAALRVAFRLPTLHEGKERVAAASEDGRVAIGGIPAASVQWSTTASGYARRVGQVTLSGQANELEEIQLSRARRGRVRVVDGSGAPVAEARVVAKGSSSGVTNKLGLIEFQELPAGAVDLQIDADGFLPAKKTLARDDAEARVVLDHGAVIRAKLLYESDGRTPEQVRVRLTNNGTESIRKIAAKNIFNLSGLQPGKARVRITAEGAMPFDSGVLSLTAGTVADLGTVMLKRGAALRGVVVDDAKVPLSGARIRLLRTDGDAPLLAHVLGSWDEATSADDGSFQLSGLTPGSHLAVIEARGFAMLARPNLSIDADHPDLDLGTMELDRGKEVRLSCRPAARCGREATLLLAGVDFPFLALRAELRNGTGTFYDVPPGDMLLRLTRSQQIVHETSVGIHRSAEPQSIDIALPSLHVHGTVSVGGEPASGGSLLFTRSVAGSGLPILLRSETNDGSSLGGDWLGAVGSATVCRVDDRGRFQSDDMEPAGYAVVFRSDSGSTAPVTITLSDSNDQALSLQFDDGRVNGTVLTAEGTPAVARIEVIDGMGGVHTTTSGADGRFDLLGLSRGRARIKATASGHVAHRDLDLRDRASDVVLRLSEQDSEGLTIAVADGAGRGVTGALAFVITSRGLAMASTDQNGNAVVSNADGASGAFPFAVYRPGGEWAFGTVRAGARATVSLPERGGRLLIRSRDASGLAAIFAPTGFPLDRVLPMVGATPQLSRESSLQIGGLSPGTYTVAVGLSRKIVSIEAGAVAVVDFEK